MYLLLLSDEKQIVGFSINKLLIDLRGVNLNWFYSDIYPSKCGAEIVFDSCCYIRIEL